MVKPRLHTPELASLAAKYDALRDLVRQGKKRPRPPPEDRPVRIKAPKMLTSSKDLELFRAESLRIFRASEAMWLRERIAEFERCLGEQ